MKSFFSLVFNINNEIVDGFTKGVNALFGLSVEA